MERPRLARRLRRIVHLALALCVVVVIVAKLPGRRVYGDANNCFGNGLEELANTEHHGGHCAPSYTKVRATEEAGGWPAIVLAAAVALGAGIVHRKPGRANAISWVVWTALAGVAILRMSLDLDLFDHVETLWASHVLGFAAGMMLVLVVIATPIVVIATREQPDSSLPGATVQ